ncbi:MAG: hypothetical protein ABIL52_00550 [candidate division WOR-3 bacterium]
MFYILAFEPLLIPPITIKEGPKNTWVYGKSYHVESIDWTYSQTPSEKVFGTPQYVKGTCQSAGIRAITNENCSFYYATDIVDFSENTLKLYVKGNGKFRISINSSKGYINQEVQLSSEWQEISFDLTKAIYITQHGSNLKTNMKISFTPISSNFEIYISKFILR